MSSGFSNVIERHRKYRGWSIAELARRSNLAQPEVSRLVNDVRTPTLRHVQGLAEALSATTKKQPEGPESYDEWVALLVDLGQEARRSARAARKAS